MDNITKEIELLKAAMRTAINQSGLPLPIKESVIEAIRAEILHVQLAEIVQASQSTQEPPSGKEAENEQ